jgi:hypothetical protein
VSRQAICAHPPVCPPAPPAPVADVGLSIKRCAGHSEIAGNLRSGFTVFNLADSASNLTVGDPAGSAANVLSGGEYTDSVRRFRAIVTGIAGRGRTHTIHRK